MKTKALLFCLFLGVGLVAEAQQIVLTRTYDITVAAPTLTIVSTDGLESYSITPLPLVSNDYTYLRLQKISPQVAYAIKKLRNINGVAAPASLVGQQEAINALINPAPVIGTGAGAGSSMPGVTPAQADTTNARLLRILNRPLPPTTLAPNAATATNQVSQSNLLATGNNINQQIYNYLSQTPFTQAKSFFQNETGTFSLDGKQLCWSVVNVGDQVAKITDDLTGTTMDIEPGHTISDHVFYRKDTNQLVGVSPITVDAGGSKLAIRWKNL